MATLNLTAWLIKCGYFAIVNKEGVWGFLGGGFIKPVHGRGWVVLGTMGGVLGAALEAVHGKGGGILGAILRLSLAEGGRNLGYLMGVLWGGGGGGQNSTQFFNKD